MSVLVILLSYLIITLIIVGSIIYIRMYKSNMNKALKGEARQGLFEPGQIIYILAIIVIIVLSSISISKINTLQNSVNDLYNQISYLKSQNSSQLSNINSLENYIEEYFQSQELIQSYEYELIDVTDEDLLVYNFSFTLLEKENSSTVSIVIKDEDNLFTIIPVTSTSLVYSVDIELNQEKNYTIDVLVEGTTTIQKNITAINVLHEIENYVWGQVRPIEYNNETETETIRLELYNVETLIDELKTDSVKFEVYIEGILVNTYNVTEKSTTVNGFDIFEVVFDLSHEESRTLTVVFTITDNLGNVRVIEKGL